MPIRPSGLYLCCDRVAFDRNPVKLWALMANKSTQKQWKTPVEASSAAYSAPSHRSPDLCCASAEVKVGRHVPIRRPVFTNVSISHGRKTGLSGPVPDSATIPIARIDESLKEFRHKKDRTPSSSAIAKQFFGTEAVHSSAFLVCNTLR
jgi:hypothetical protein